MCNYCFIYDVTSEANDSGNILQKNILTQFIVQ